VGWNWPGRGRIRRTIEPRHEKPRHPASSFPAIRLHPGQRFPAFGEDVDIGVALLPGSDLGLAQVPRRSFLAHDRKREDGRRRVRVCAQRGALFSSSFCFCFCFCFCLRDITV